MNISPLSKLKENLMPHQVARGRRNKPLQVLHVADKTLRGEGDRHLRFR